MNRLRGQAQDREANQLFMRLELQADRLSEVWNRHIAAKFGLIELSNLDEALNAAARIGYSALQKRS